MDCADRKLAIGDIEQNLESLKSLETPPMDDSVIRKIWALLQDGCPQAPLVEAVGLLQHLGWSSSTVEQQHASATLVRRQHKKYGMQMLLSRAALHTARLFYVVDPLDLEEQKLQLKLQAQMDQKVIHIPGNAMLYKKMMDIQGFMATRKKMADTPSGLSYAGVHKVMGLAGKGWDGLTVAQQESLRRAGRIEGVKKANDNAQAAIQTERAILELRVKKKLEGMSRLPPRMIFSSCRFGPADEESMMEMFRSELFSKRSVHKRRQAAQTHDMLSDAKLLHLDAVPILQKALPAEPWWLSVVANCRDAFAESAVVIGSGEAARYFKFLYAKKAPRGASFCPLALREPEYTRVLGLQTMGDEEEPVSWRYRFTCERMDSREAWQIDSDANSTVYVLMGVLDKGDQVVADGPLILLSEFLRNHPGLEPRARRETPGPRAQRTAEEKAEWKRLLLEYPWLAQIATASARAKRARVEGDSRVVHEGDRPSDDEEEDAAALDEEVEEILDEESVQKIFSDLAEMREEWAAKYSAMVLEDFKISLLGGHSTFKATSSKGKAGVVSDFVCCEVDSARAKAFVLAYGLQQSKRASIRLYDLGPATILAEAWGHRLQYYLDRYLTSGDVRYSFTVADHNAYEEPASFTNLADQNKAVEDVVQSIRSVVPFCFVGERANECPGRCE